MDESERQDGRSYAVALPLLLSAATMGTPGIRAFRCTRCSKSPARHVRTTDKHVAATPGYGREAFAHVRRADDIPQRERRHRLHRTHADAADDARRTAAADADRERSTLPADPGRRWR